MSEDDRKVEEFLYIGTQYGLMRADTKRNVQLVGHHIIRQQEQFHCARINNSTGLWTISDGDHTRVGKSIEEKVYLDREIPHRPNPHKRPFVSQVIPLGREGIFALIDKWSNNARILSSEPQQPQEQHSNGVIIL